MSSVQTPNPFRPIVGISVGDPGGIGPEITAKTLALKEIYEEARPLAVADAWLMREAVRIAGLDLKVHPVQTPAEGSYALGTIDVLDLGNIDPATLVYKKPTAENGKAAFEYISKVIDLAMKGDIHATVTGPIHKEAINAAGFHYSGHTEIYADLTRTKDYAMMLADKGFRVVHVSTHVSLREACDRVKKDRILRVIRLTDDTLKILGIPSARIAVAGLNPHAGEGGLFGKEEIEEIQPAIAQALSEGFRVEGPIPPDTVFSKMKGGQYDAVVVMYHDQGHIPTKLIGFQYNEKENRWEEMAGINMTLGLPIIRVSVDHGVAFGKAGEGRANPQSMVEAVRMATLLARGKFSG